MSFVSFVTGSHKATTIAGVNPPSLLTSPHIFDLIRIRRHKVFDNCLLFQLTKGDSIICSAKCKNKANNAIYMNIGSEIHINEKLHDAFSLVSHNGRVFLLYTGGLEKKFALGIKKSENGTIIIEQIDNTNLIVYPHQNQADFLFFDEITNEIVISFRIISHNQVQIKSYIVTSPFSLVAIGIAILQYGLFN